MSGETKAAVSGWSTDTLKEHLDRRIDEVEKRHDQKFTDTAFAYAEKFKHLEQTFTVVQDGAKRAVDKAEAAQHAHNVAANEWRATLNDFKTNVPSKSEFDRFYQEFSAFKLEQSRAVSMDQGDKYRSKEHRDDSKSWLAIGIAVATAIIMAMTFMSGR